MSRQSRRSASVHGHSHSHEVTFDADRRWLLAALGVILAFMAVEVVAGVLAHSLALLTDAGHMATDAGAIGVAVVAASVSRRPARGPYTFGFGRVDGLSGQVNGVTLLLLAIGFAVFGVRRLIDPGPVHGVVVGVVALIGVAVNVLATWLAGRADRRSLNVRGVFGHLLTDVWAFAATLAAGIVITFTGWTRADALASLLVAALMAYTGVRLVGAAGRVFLEAAPSGIDPDEVGRVLAGLEGVAEIHDLHVWQLGPGSDALTAHVLVSSSHDCHRVSARVRELLARGYGLRHVTLQTEHADAVEDAGDECTDTHGEIYASTGDM